jgi:hypothetical protein
MKKAIFVATVPNVGEQLIYIVNPDNAVGKDLSCGQLLTEDTKDIPVTQILAEFEDWEWRYVGTDLVKTTDNYHFITPAKNNSSVILAKVTTRNPAEKALNDIAKII